MNEEIKQLSPEQINHILYKKRKPVYWLFWFSIPSNSKSSGKRQVLVQDYGNKFYLQKPPLTIDEYAFASMEDLLSADKVIWKNWKGVSNYAVEKEIRRINWEINQ